LVNEESVVTRYGRSVRKDKARREVGSTVRNRPPENVETALTAISRAKHARSSPKHVFSFSFSFSFTKIVKWSLELSEKTNTPQQDNS